MEGRETSHAAEFKVGRKKNGNICAHCISVKVYSPPDNTNQRDTAWPFVFHVLRGARCLTESLRVASALGDEREGWGGVEEGEIR